MDTLWRREFGGLYASRRGWREFLVPGAEGILRFDLALERFLTCPWCFEDGALCDRLIKTIILIRAGSLQAKAGLQRARARGVRRRDRGRHREGDAEGRRPLTVLHRSGASRRRMKFLSTTRHTWQGSQHQAVLADSRLTLPGAISIFRHAHLNAKTSCGTNDM